MSGGFPDPDVRVHAATGRLHVQVRGPEGWLTVCMRERQDAARAIRDGLVRLMSNNTDIRHKAGTQVEDFDEGPAQRVLVHYDECECWSHTQPIPLMHEPSCPIHARHPGPFPETEADRAYAESVK